MYTNSFFKNILFLALTISLGSCDKDYNTIGGDLVENDHFGLVSQDYSVIAYTQKTGAVQSNDLPVNPLGIYNDLNFGETTANIVVQTLLTTEKTTFGEKPEISSVVLNVPYFSTKLSTDATTGASEYRLDSIYGTSKAKMKLSIYESGSIINNLGFNPDGSFTDDKKYYSDDTQFDTKKVGNRLNDDPTNKAENDEFVFDNREHSITTTVDSKEVITRTVPSLQLHLNKDFFKIHFIENPSTLVSNDVFKNYFKGLYFKIEKVDAEGQMAMLDFSKGSITINYKEGATTARVDKSLVLTFNLTRKVSLQTTDNSTSGIAFKSLPDKGDITAGDPKLYLKGGNGSMAVISLFSNPADLQLLKNSKSKINEANLVFNIDAGVMSKSAEPNRVYLYDLTNNLPIADYYADVSSNNNFPKKGKIIYDGIIKKITTNNVKAGISYKINITNHLRNIVQNGKDNVKLGLVVTENIYNIANNVWKTPMKLDSNDLGIPTASVMNPLGTVLYGGNASVSDDKRLKLQIYYTKPN
jgi:Domain of unknown function (DUF4270)